MRTLWVALACACVLAIGAGGALAETIELPNGDLGFRASWSSLELEAAGTTIRCALTIEGSFDSQAIPTLARSPVGTVISASLTGCTGGSASVLSATLPWHLQYASFTGVLPNIASVKLRLPDANISGVFGGLSCLARASDAEPVMLAANIANGTMTSVEAEVGAGIRLEGGGLCSFAGPAHVRGRSTTPVTWLGAWPINVVQGPAANGPWVMSVGDSFISGEAGRWAGNTTQGPSSRIDRGQRWAYWDNARHTAEEIPFCHRSVLSAEIMFGRAGGPRSMNFACSGATVRTTTDAAGHFKPGLDFPVGGGRSQLTDLRFFAEWNPHVIRMVTVSIGGNDFHFGEVVAFCMEDFVVWRIFCESDPRVTAFFTPAAIQANQAAIKQAIEDVHRAMADARYLDNEYTIMVQGYESLLPPGNLNRYNEELLERWRTGGCAFYNRDAEWTNTTVLPTINGAIWAAVAQLPFGNVRRLDLRNAFVTRRLCERGVRLIERMLIREPGGQMVPAPYWWAAVNSIDESEWVNQIHREDAGDLLRQESLHPNSWGQRALRNCLRLAYNNGAARDGSCVISAYGANEYGEPRMALNAFAP